MSAVLDVLKAGRELIADPERWTQGTYARDADGNRVYYDSPAAVCWCSQGAVLKFEPNVRRAYEVVSVLGRVTPGRNLVLYQDLHTHAETLAVWDAAIAAEEVAA